MFLLRLSSFPSTLDFKTTVAVAVVFQLRWSSFPSTLDFKATVALCVGERLLDDVIDNESDDVGDGGNDD